MKKIILYIGSLERGGAERVLSNIANHLSDKYNVILVTDIITENAEVYPLRSAIKRLNLGIINGGLRGNIKRIKMLREIINEEKPDAVLSFMGPNNIRMLLASRHMSLRKIVSVRNDPNFEYGKGFKKIFARNIFRKASGCVFQTSDAMAYFPKSVQKKSTIIWNPVASQFFENPWNCTKEQIIVVGRLTVQKNPLLALSAFQLIADEFPNIELAYFGSGELKDEILAAARKCRLSERVHITENVADIESHVRNSRLFLLTSDFEGMPNSLLEAMAIGIPIIATDCPCGGPRTIVKGFGDKVLIPCRNPEAAAEKMRRILLDETAQNELCHLERERSELFRTAVVMKKWEDFLFKN